MDKVSITGTPLNKVYQKVVDFPLAHSIGHRSYVVLAGVSQEDNSQQATVPYVLLLPSLFLRLFAVIGGQAFLNIPMPTSIYVSNNNILWYE